MIILAHRGLSGTFCPPNSYDAIESALREGFGAEFDIRMGQQNSHGELVVCHDTPPEYGVCLARDVEETARKRYPNAVLAVNVKEEGLLCRVRREFDRKENVFFFDMSGPDLYRYVQDGLPVLERCSDIGERPLFGSTGLWVDGIGRTWPCDKMEWDEVSEWIAGRSFVAFVSPEVHGHSHEEFWKDLRKWEASRGAIQNADLQVAICTDLAYEAQKFFNVTDLSAVRFTKDCVEDLR